MFSLFKKLLDKLLDKLPGKNKKHGYYFIHIPKTAGTSFINLLDGCVNQDEIFPAQLWHEINQELVDNKHQYRLLRGHFGGGSDKLLCSGHPHKLTLLRHPQSLSISTFHFIKREKNTAVHALVKDKYMDLRAFLEEPLTVHKINNRMVRHLSFDLQQDPEAQELFLSTQSIKVVSQWIKAPKKLTSKQRLKRAKQALDACSWFGIQEKFDQSMQLFAYVFQRPAVGETQYLNAHNPNQNIDHYCKELIANQNEEDLALYQYGLDIFQQRYAAMCEQLNNTYANQNLSLDAMLDKHYQNAAHNIMEKGCEYDFGMPLLGQGWHRRELTQPENTYFRWSSHNYAFIDFWLKPQDYQMHIRIINAVSINHLSELTLSINEQSVPYTYDVDDGVVRIISSKISALMFHNNLLRIRFSHRPCLTHSDIFASDDRRDLGIAVNWVKIIPCQV